MIESRSVNFEFLRPHDELLARIGLLAELTLYTDPANTAGKTRLFVEKSVDLIYEMFRLPLPERYGAAGRKIEASLFDKLKEHAFESVVPKAILDKLHFVRLKGNLGVHALNANTAVATDLLREARDIASWLYVMFWNGRVEDLPAFKLPPNPMEAQAQRKEAEKHLKDRLASQEAELQVVLEKLEAATAQLAAPPPVC